MTADLCPYSVPKCKIDLVEQDQKKDQIMARNVRRYEVTCEVRRQEASVVVRRPAKRQQQSLHRRVLDVDVPKIMQQRRSIPKVLDVNYPASPRLTPPTSTSPLLSYEMLSIPLNLSQRRKSETPVSLNTFKTKLNLAQPSQTIPYSVNLSLNDLLIPQGQTHTVILKNSFSFINLNNEISERPFQEFNNELRSFSAEIDKDFGNDKDSLAPSEKAKLLDNDDVFDENKSQGDEKENDKENNKDLNKFKDLPDKENLKIKISVSEDDKENEDDIDDAASTFSTDDVDLASFTPDISPPLTSRKTGPAISVESPDSPLRKEGPWSRSERPWSRSNLRQSSWTGDKSGRASPWSRGCSPFSGDIMYHDKNELNPDILADMLGPGMAKSLNLDAGFGKSPRHSPAPPKKGFTKEAKAGLQEKVDFTEVKLNKNSKQKAVREVVGGQEQIPKEFLVKIKGKQSMQTRLVNPNFSSLSKQDVFIFVCEEKLVQFNGTHASVLKKAKGTEICKRISLKSEHGCTVQDSTKIEESRGSFIMTNFFKSLDQKKDSPVADGSKDDEGYEKEQNGSNIVYMLDNDTKVFDRLDEISGRKLSHSRLNDQQIYCFDFGPEVYLWIGKGADKGSRKIAMLEARAIFDEKTRPSWGIFQRIADGLETSLFKEKFQAWPDSNTSNVLKPINTCAPKDNAIPMQSLETCNGEEMKQPLSDDPPGLELEMTDMGRGKGVPTDLSKDQFGHDVETTSIKVWRITENSYEDWPEACYGAFYSAEAFIVRWGYRVMQGGKKTEHDTGRDRTCYFFWQGLDCSTKDKGTSAFMTVEVDVERAPQKIVQQGGEPAAFTGLFSGGMIVYKGKISEQRDLKMFVYRGELPEEGVLTELTDVSPHCFRSRTSMLLAKDDKVHVWHGCKSRSHTVYGAQVAAEKLVNRMATSENVSEYQEGAESKAFWDLFPGGKDTDYFSLRDDERIYSKSPRLFRLYEDKQAFVYRETDYLLRAKDLVAPYPLIQEDLYTGADQPALFLLDAHFTVYVWQGWWPTHSPDGTPLTHTGSAKTDHVEKYKLALQTAVNYVEACSYKETPDMVIVSAGSEPEEFRALFPWWTHQQVGSKPSLTGSSMPLNNELQKFLQTEYTLAELQEKPIGCDPLKLEEYLSTKEFEAIFNMPKKAFAQLPRWKQSALKKPHRLF